MDSDRELVNRIGQRDSQAFDALTQRYGEQIRRHLYAIVRCDSAADDLLQEVLLRLWTRWDQWTGAGPLRAWLTGTATNLALNHLRGQRRKRQLPLEPPQASDDPDDDGLTRPWLADPSAVGPHEAIEQAEQRNLLRHLLDALPEQRRQMLRHVYNDDMPLADVADALGIPLGTVKSRMHYTLRALGRQWNELQDE